MNRKRGSLHSGRCRRIGASFAGGPALWRALRLQTADERVRHPPGLPKRIAFGFALRRCKQRQIGPVAEMGDALGPSPGAVRREGSTPSGATT